MRDSNIITIHLLDDSNLELIGTNTISVPCSYLAKELKAGETVDSGCQLAIELKNFDLMRIGINPLNTIYTDSEWIKLIFHRLFKRDPKNCAVLWVYEPSGLYRLLPE